MCARGEIGRSAVAMIVILDVHAIDPGDLSCDDLKALGECDIPRSMRAPSQNCR